MSTPYSFNGVSLTLCGFSTLRNLKSFYTEVSTYRLFVPIKKPRMLQRQGNPRFLSLRNRMFSHVDYITPSVVLLGMRLDIANNGTRSGPYLILWTYNCDRVFVQRSNFQSVLRKRKHRHNDGNQSDRGRWLLVAIQTQYRWGRLLIVTYCRIGE